jgi:nucleoside-diphosphate-sugar epimerase
MVTDTRKDTVLVTGGSGFLGGHAVVALLERGYRVRATIRDLRREPEMRASLGEGIAQDRLSLFAADLLHDAGWDQAVQGAQLVMHVASPMPVGEYRGTDVVTPARAGTKRVLEAAARASVRRVVLTSSTVTALPNDPAQIVDETVWTDLAAKHADDYVKAKTLAERDAWELAKTANYELVTVLPAFIFGPVLGRDYSASIEAIAMMLRGKMPLTPRIGFNIIDVRDLVDLHLRALEVPAAAGERFIGGGDFRWLSEVAALLREHLGMQAARVPERNLPDFVVRLGALVNPEMRSIAPNLGVRREVSSAKAERVLGWSGRPIVESILDTARSLIQLGLG